jgi:hypothetical protein
LLVPALLVPALLVPALLVPALLVPALVLPTAAGAATTRCRHRPSRGWRRSRVELTRSTADVTWVLDPEADTVNYLGRAETKFAVVLATATTDRSGHFSVVLKAPRDWGGVHDIYAVIGGLEDAHGGFIILRSLTVSPRRGPIGTPITITYSGLGASEYEGGGSLLWDNHFVGEMMANWTRGVAQVTIRASGPVGPHIVEVGDAVDFLYLNLPQSTLPYAKAGTARFTVTKDDGPPSHLSTGRSILPPRSATSRP